jgi:general secretion pathway protein I
MAERVAVRQQGFGLLEALVAMVILAGSGMALFAWINQNLRDLVRIEQAQARAALQLTAQGLLVGVNPFQEPAGERRVGAVQVRWRGQLISPLRPSFPFAGARSPRWQVGLYRLEVKVTDEVQGLEAEFTLDQTGLELLDAGRPPRVEPPP